MSAPSQVNASSQTSQPPLQSDDANRESGTSPTNGTSTKIADLSAALKIIYAEWQKDPNIARGELCKKLVVSGATPEFADQAIKKAKELRKLQQEASAVPKSAKRQRRSSTQRNAEEAQRYAGQLKSHIEKAQGTFLQDDANEFSVLIRGHRIELNFDPANYPLNKLLLEVCNITLHDSIAKSVIVRLGTAGYGATNKFAFRKFSAMSKDKERLYIPLKDSAKVLCISAAKVEVVPNGKNQDKLWLEHPNLDPDAEALDYVDADPAEGLREFERLVVNSMAVRDPGMNWFLALQETIYPFLRELNNDRIVTHHDGIQGSGKTTGAMWPAHTLGLMVTGDTTPAALNRVGDCGLLVMDNKESANFSVGFNGYVIYLATGALSLRAQGDGYKARNQSRPVGVITSIEGAIKPETIDRMFRVSFNANERDRSHLDKDAHLLEIRQKRSLVVSALVRVLYRFMQLKQEGLDIAVPKAIDRFNGNYRNLVLMLRAYADVARKPAGWVEARLAEWERGIQVREEDHEAGNEFSHFVEQFQRALNVAYEILNDELGSSSKRSVDELLQPIVDRGASAIEYTGQNGALTKFTASEVLDWLKQKNPRNNTLANMIPNTLATRLRGITLENGARILTKHELPELGQRPRESGKPQRFIGLFEPVDQPKMPAKPAQPVTQKQAQKTKPA